jgi:hypothetical protein
MSASEKPLSFIVFVPQWNDSPYYELLSRSKFTRHIANHAKGTHTYVRGFQHVDETPQPGISYAHSSVFVMQNDAAVRASPITAADLEKINNAMCKNK